MPKLYKNGFSVNYLSAIQVLLYVCGCMKYFKVVVTYILANGEVDQPQKEQIIYCNSVNDFPNDEQLKDLFYSLDETGKKYLSAQWKQVRGEEIPTDEIHLL